MTILDNCQHCILGANFLLQTFGTLFCFLYYRNSRLSLLYYYIVVRVCPFSR